MDLSLTMAFVKSAPLASSCSVSIEGKTEFLALPGKYTASCSIYLASSVIMDACAPKFFFQFRLPTNVGHELMQIKSSNKWGSKIGSLWSHEFLYLFCYY